MPQRVVHYGINDVHGSTLVLWIQTVSSVITFIFALSVCVSMSMHQEQFRGHCLLFSDGEWRETDGQLIVNWASQAYCNYTIFIAVVLALVSCVQGFKVIKWVVKSRGASFLAAFIDVCVSGLLCFMAFIAAMFVTLGFKAWCKQMTTRFSSCRDAEANDIGKADGIDTSHFYLQMFTAQLGIWGAATSMLVNMIFSLVGLFRYHWLENLRVSMARERRRLINEDMVSEVAVPGQQPPPTRPLQQPEGAVASGLISRSRGGRNRDREALEGRFEEVREPVNGNEESNSMPEADRGSAGGVNSADDDNQSEARVQVHSQASPINDQQQQQQKVDMSSSISSSSSPKGNQIISDDDENDDIPESSPPKNIKKEPLSPVATPPAAATAQESTSSAAIVKKGAADDEDEDEDEYYDDDEEEEDEGNLSSDRGRIVKHN